MSLRPLLAKWKVWGLWSQRYPSSTTKQKVILGQGFASVSLNFLLYRISATIADLLGWLLITRITPKSAFLSLLPLRVPPALDKVTLGLPWGNWASSWALALWGDELWPGPWQPRCSEMWFSPAGKHPGLLPWRPFPWGTRACDLGRWHVNGLWRGAAQVWSPRCWPSRSAGLPS